MAARTIVLVTARGETDPPEPLTVDRDQIVKIGRAGTLRIHDLLVNPQHAKIYFDPVQDAWVVEDLDTSNGTFVNNQCVRGGTKKIGPGATLKFGDTVLKVESSSGRLMWILSRTAVAVPGCGLLMAGLVAGLLLAWTTLRGGTSAVPVLEWSKGPIMTPDEGRVSRIQVPRSFLFEYGVARLQIHNVSDADDDGSDEVWLDADGGQRSFVVEMAKNKAWTVLGAFPRGSANCIRQGSATGGFPPVDCNGESWMLEPNRSQYRPVRFDGPVVWYIKTKPAPAPHDPKSKTKAKVEVPQEAPRTPSMGDFLGRNGVKVGRFALKDTERMGQFLGERGIYVPIHYLICEDAFPELQAQVLTYEGAIQEIKPACIQQLRLEGPSLKENWQPVAVAFTPAGYQALVDDVTTFYTGAPDGLWASKEHQSVIEQLKGDPGVYQGGIKLIAETNVGVPYPDPRAAQDAEVSGARVLLSKDRQAKPAPLATGVVVPGPGEHAFAADPAGGRCQHFKVDWREGAGGCRGGAPTIDISEVGCGEPRSVLRTELTNGNHDRPFDDLQVRLAVDAAALDGSVRRVRLTWRVKE